MRALLLVTTILFSNLVWASQPVQAKHGMVVSEQSIASRVGVDILRQGGNAIDAAVAVGYALAVVLPGAGNLGGGGFMTIHLANGKNIVINFRERAPLHASKNMFLDKSGHVIPNASTEGYLAVAIPGTVMGLETALAKYGKLPRQIVMAPAIALAEDGYRLSDGDMPVYKKAVPYFKKYFNVAEIFLKNGFPYKSRDKFIQKNLANTLRLIAAEGSKGFYEGEIAQKIVAASQKNGGILTLEDFKNYKVEELKPISCTYRSYTVITVPPPSSGGVTLCEALNILEGYPLAKYGFHTQASLHYLIEAMRFAFADRNVNLGDPDFVTNPLQRMLSKQYAAFVREHIQSKRATPSSQLPLAYPPREGNQTTHYSVMDKWGNAVSVTVTLNSYYGAKVIAGDTGFFLNNEMDDFTTAVDQPNQFGLVQGEKNAIAGGKRPLSSMTPTILLRGKNVAMVVGSPGGPRIITSVLQTILNTLDFGMNIQDAVDAKRVHQQWLPDIVYVEPDAISQAIMAMMNKQGYQIQQEDPWSAVEAIYVDTKARILLGGSDSRRSAGAAIGY